MRTFRRLCVVCGSSAGRQPAYADAARDLGRTLAKRSIGVVYGGARAGLMGVVADAACAAGGEVTGVITPDLAARVGHDGVYVEVVETLHQRKQRFADLADGYIALPGGFGTLEELFEAATWNQLGIQDKPTGLLNVGGYFDGLPQFPRPCRARRLRPARTRGEPACCRRGGVVACGDGRAPAAACREVERWLDEAQRSWAV